MAKSITTINDGLITQALCRARLRDGIGNWCCTRMIYSHVVTSGARAVPVGKASRSNVVLREPQTGSIAGTWDAAFRCATPKAELSNGTDPAPTLMIKREQGSYCKIVAMSLKCA